MDINLTSDSEYRYSVKAVANNGEISDSSTILIVRTKKAVSPVIPEKPETNTWDPQKIYYRGETVTYNGVNYKAKWWSQNNVPNASDNWEQISNGLTDGSVEYIKGKSYKLGIIVKYNGHSYKAKWWTNTTPGSDGSWQKL